MDLEGMDGGVRSGVGGGNDDGGEIVGSGSMPVTSSGTGPPNPKGKVPRDDVPCTPVAAPSKSIGVLYPSCSLS